MVPPLFARIFVGAPKVAPAFGRCLVVRVSGNAMESRLNNQTRVVAAVFALSGFAVAIGCGLAAGNDGSTVVARALAAMLGCQLVGMLAGAVVEKVTQQHETTYRANHPVPRAASDVVVVDEVVDESTDKARAAA